MIDLPCVTEKDLQGLSWEKQGEKILNNDNKYNLSFKERQILKALLYKSRPPLKYRKQLWLISSGAIHAMKNNPNYYKTMLDLSKQMPSPSSNQIELDLKRTFPEDKKAMEESFIKKLRNVLTCYSIRNSTVGYCQGMNFIVGKLLLLIEDEEKVFWLFAQMIEYLLPLNFYIDLAGVITETALTSLLFQQYLPYLHQFIKINKLELIFSNFINKWLLGVFAQNFNIYLADIILDFFFLEGNIALIKSCLGIFAYLEDQLINSSDSEKIYLALSETVGQLKNEKILLYFLAFRKFKFKKKNLEHFRQELGVPIINNLRQDKITNRKNKMNPLFLQYKPKKKIHCDPKWPFCIYDTNLYDIVDYLVYNFQKKPIIIDEYYYVKTFSYPNHDNFNKIDGFFASNNRDILCERKKHTCDDRKLVENSVMMLEENKSKSEDVDLNSKNDSNKLNIDMIDVYKIAVQGKEILIAQEKILEELNDDEEIYEDEIKEFL